MATGTTTPDATSTLTASITTVSSLSTGFHAGVIVHAVIGSISTLALLILLAHIISVSFLPLCLSALNIRKNQGTIEHSSSTNISTSVDLVASGLPDRKSNSVVPRKNSDEAMYEIDLERTRAVAERRARARAREISRQKTKYDEEKLFLRMQLGVFIVCMLFSDLIQSVGVLIQARWAHLGYVETSTACWVQAAMITFGDVATAVWNAVIACHTFSTVVLGLRMSSLGITIVVICGWCVPVLMNVLGSVLIAHGTPQYPYYDVAFAWCFIGNHYVTPRVALHYVPLLFASLIITIMYALVSLTMRGNLQVTATRNTCIPWFSVTFRRTSVGKRGSGNTNQKQVLYLRSLSLKMLWYPCVYICLILPISICRMVELNGKRAPPELLFTAMTLLFCVGLSNVAIYVTTRNVGVSSKRNALVYSLHPPSGTQMEIYVDRITQQDAGVVTIGGSRTGMGRDKNIRFEDVNMDNLKPSIEQKENEYEASSKSSLDRDYSYPDSKSPTSASQFVSASPDASSPVSATASHHPHQSLTSPARVHNYNNSVGSVVLDRLGTPPPHKHPAFVSSFTDRERTNPNDRGPITLFAQVQPATISPSRVPVNRAVRNSYHTWE